MYQIMLKFLQIFLTNVIYFGYCVRPLFKNFTFKLKREKGIKIQIKAIGVQKYV